MTRTRDDVLKELAALNLDADAFAEMLVNARLAHKARAAPTEVPDEKNHSRPGHIASTRRDHNGNNNACHQQAQCTVTATVRVMLRGVDTPLRARKPRQGFCGS